MREGKSLPDALPGIRDPAPAKPSDFSCRRPLSKEIAVTRTFKPFSTLAAALLSIAALTAAQTGDLKPSDNLVVEGVPPIPEALAEAARPYTDVRTAFFTSWHPQRHEMLIGTRFGNSFQVHEVKGPGAARTQLTFYAEPVFGGEFDPVHGDSFVFVKDRGG